MTSTIKMNCDCGKIHEVGRDSDAPQNAISMGCNWCPNCEDTAENYYQEWYNLDEGESEGNNDDDGDPNQLIMFSIADEILNQEVKQEIEKQSKDNDKI